jgi:hypothetical protein
MSRLHWASIDDPPGHHSINSSTTEGIGRVAAQPIPFTCTTVPFSTTTVTRSAR